MVNAEKNVSDVQWAICPICHQNVLQKRLAKHKQKVHQQPVLVTTLSSITNAYHPTTRKLVKCPECKCDVAESNLSAHITRAHGKTALARVNAVNQANENRSNRKIVCPGCREQIRLGDIKSHFGNAHSKPAPAHLLKLLGEKPARNKFRTAQEKNEYWRKFDGLDSKRSNDILDQGPKIVIGGAYTKFR